MSFIRQSLPPFLRPPCVGDLIRKPAGAGGVAAGGGLLVDQFNGANGSPLDPGIWSTYNAAAIPGVEQRDGRYRAPVLTNAGNQTVWYLSDDGRLDYVRVAFPFEIHFLGIGIGRIDDAAAAPIPGTHLVASPYAFCGAFVHDLVLGSLNYRAYNVGHRGGTHYTIEQKNSDGTGFNSIVDEGANFTGSPGAPNTVMDLRVRGLANQTVEFDNRAVGETTWVPATEAGFRFPTFGPEVFVGPATYEFGTHNGDWVGRVDEIRQVA